MDAPEHLDLGVGTPREMQQANHRLPSPSRPRLEMVVVALCPPQRIGLLMHFVHTASLETARARATVQITGPGTRFRVPSGIGAGRSRLDSTAGRVDQAAGE
jgi:hypothetical protein